MSSTADGRVFREEDPTATFESEQLDALRARSLEKSSVFNPAIDRSASGVVTAPHPVPPRPPTPTSPEFLGKGPAVLVLPSEPPPAAPPVAARAPTPAPPANVIVEAPAPAPVDVPSPPRVGAEPPAREAVVVRSHRRISTRIAVKPRRRVWRQVFKLALLALVVLCQPWWWNVGDLHARPPAPKSNVTAK